MDDDAQDEGEGRPSLNDDLDIFYDDRNLRLMQVRIGNGFF